MNCFSFLLIFIFIFFPGLSPSVCLSFVDRFFAALRRKRGGKKERKETNTPFRARVVVKDTSVRVAVGIYGNVAARRL